MNSVAFLTDLALRATAVFSFAFVAMLALRGASASVRYVVWSCVFVAVLVLPLLSIAGPRWEIQLAAPAVAPTSAIDRIVVTPARQPARDLPWLLIVWSAGALAMLVRAAVGQWRLRSRFRAAPEVVDPQWTALLAQASTRIGMRRPVDLRRSAAADVPFSFGLFRTTVMLPGASEKWSEEQRRIVLLHEVFHGARRDSLWSLVAQIAVALHWFNPLAWLANGQFRREQERSCDDAVVRAGTGSAVYAAQLVEVARSIALPSAAVGMAEPFDLERRVKALLEPERNRNAAGRASWATVLAILVAIVMPLAAVHAQQPSPPASLSGTVYDPSGAVVPGAQVTLRSIGATNEEFARADEAGHYVFRTILAGQYNLEVRAVGFAAYRHSLSFNPATPSTLNVALYLGDVAEAVEVVGKGAPPAPQGVPQRIRVGGNVQATKLISKGNPTYPADAAAAGVEGTVVLRAVVSKEGNLLNLQTISGAIDARLVRAATDAVQLWHYQPTLLNGAPVEVITTIAVTFRLQP